MLATPLTRTCSAILVAAGSSQRMGFDKLAAPLAGISVLRRAIAAFALADCISEIIVVCPEERWQTLDLRAISKPIFRVSGGSDRQASVAAGLARVSGNSRFVAVHDGARPLISPADIDRCAAAAAEHHAATLARRVTETLKRGSADDFTAEPVSREHLWHMETPQIFEIQLLRDAYAAVKSHHLTITDEVSALEAIGHRVKLVESLHSNLKITTPADLALAEALLK